MLINVYDQFVGSRFVFLILRPEQTWKRFSIAHCAVSVDQGQTRTFSIVYDSDQGNDFHVLTQQINFNDKTETTSTDDSFLFSRSSLHPYV